MAKRWEKDSFGRVRIDDAKYYGINTFRALENFQISGIAVPIEIIKAIALIKLAYCKSHLKKRTIESKKASAIIKAAKEVLSGKFDQEFLVDVFQTGSGTSTNMNVNEVIANRAVEILGGKKGDKNIVHPNDDVNKGQSSNDVFPSSIQIALLIQIRKKLTPALKKLKKALSKKSNEFKNISKAGRTHLMDALPITLGDEFSAYSSQIKHSIDAIEVCEKELLFLPLGGTAVGSGFGTSRDVSRQAINFINKETKIKFKQAENLYEGLGAKENLLHFSSALKRTAVALMKICEDLRLMASGPKCGLSEVSLPELQAGSSIMAGKVNPVILEMTQMVCAEIIGFDSANTICAMGGRLELNVMMPLLSFNLIFGTKVLSNTAETLAEKCVQGIVANQKKCEYYAESTPSIVTFLQPYVGYDKASLLYKEAVEKNISIRNLIIEKRLMSEREISEIFDFYRKKKK